MRRVEDVAGCSLSYRFIEFPLFLYDVSGEEPWFWPPRALLWLVNFIEQIPPNIMCFKEFPVISGFFEGKYLEIWTTSPSCVSFCVGDASSVSGQHIQSTHSESPSKVRVWWDWKHGWNDGEMGCVFNSFWIPKSWEHKLVYGWFQSLAGDQKKVRKSWEDSD